MTTPTARAVAAEPPPTGPLPVIGVPIARGHHGASRRQVWIKWAIGLGLGVVFTWLSLRSMPIGQLFNGSLAFGRDLDGDAAVVLADATGAAVWSLDFAALALYVAMLTAIHWLRVLRWHPLLEPYARVPIRTLNRTGAIGFMVLFLLPLRLGEFARPILLARDTGEHDPVPVAAGLGTIALERVLDGLLVALLLFVVLFEIHPATLSRYPEVQVGAWIALGVFAAALGGLLATLVAREFTLRWTRRIVGAVSVGLADKIIGLVTSFVDGLRVMRSPLHALQFIGLTVLYWGVNGLGIWVLARGFGVQMPIVAAYAMMSCLVVGMMVPSGPANAGTFWYCLLLPAGLYGVDDHAPRTVAFALGLWLVQTAQLAVFGLWGSWADARVIAALRDDEEDAESP